MKIVAIGGYLSEYSARESFNTPIVIDEQVVRLSGKKRPNVLFLSTASSDEESYVGGFYRTYENRLGCHVDTLRLVSAKPTDTEIRDNIERADVIYVGGGNTLKMMNLWRRRGIDRLLKRAAARDTVLAGESAGSICWFRWGVSDSRQYYHGRLCHEYIRVSGLGLLQGAHSPHFSGPRGRRDRDAAIKTIMKRTPGACLCIQDGCAVIVEDDRYRVLSGVDHANAYRTFYRGGAYVTEALPVHGKTSDLFHIPN